MHATAQRIGCAGILIGLLAVAEAHATNAVVQPPDCNENGFEAALATVDGSGGGTVSFDCGAVTIALTGYKQIAHATTIDGGGRITFDGGGASAFFQIFASADATLRGLTLQNGTFASAHAIENFGTLTLDGVRVLDNASPEAAFMNYGEAAVVASTFSNNSATSSTTGDGGAIANLGSLLWIRASTFDSNSARRGGAVYSAASLDVVNSTFSANAASNGGGAIYQDQSGLAFIDYVTAVGNTAVFGAGLYNEGSSGSSTMRVGHSLLSGNVEGNCDGVIQSSGYNLSDDTHCGSAFTGTGDLNDVALPMQALGAYGGPTETQPPAAGNPAIDHVPPGDCNEAEDQRFALRPFGAGCDSGSVEAGATPDDVIFADGFDEVVAP